MTLGQKIQLIRKENNLTQEDFADKLGVSRQTVSRWEKGHTEPELDKIRTMGDEFGVSKEFLLNEGHADGFLHQHRPRTIFWIATVVIFAGLGVATLGWSVSRAVAFTLLGVILNIVGCLLFECHLCGHMEKYLRVHMRYQFYILNIWMLLPAPFFLIISLTLFFEQYRPVLPYIIGGGIYLIMATTITWKLLRRIRMD